MFEGFRGLQGRGRFNAREANIERNYCWGEIWTRESLPHKIRSMLNIAMLAALDRPHELKTHVRGALNNGCTREEIQGILLQVTVYCGVPAGVEAFRAAREAFADIEQR